LKLAITGQDGFIGFHLYNTIKIKCPEIEIVKFQKDFFKNDDKIDQLIKGVDVIVHLAGLNRAEDQDFLFNQNLLLANKIIQSIKRVNFQGKVIFASSIQEDLDNAYGKAKKKSRELFSNESKENEFSFIGLIIPNVFGAFCKPNYNSFISTFCNNSISGLENTITEDKQVPLIYIDNLIIDIIKAIKEKSSNFKKVINEDLIISVSEVKKIIGDYYETYFQNGEIPNLDSSFKINLFNTFNSFIPFKTYYPKKYSPLIDSRGIFSEVIRANMLGQYSYSITQPGETRGNHFHTRKIERFAVIHGEALIELRRIGSNKKLEYNLNGNTPSYIDMPIWHTHNIRNTGEVPLITLFWINEFYSEDDSDTFFEKV